MTTLPRHHLRVQAWIRPDVDELVHGTELDVADDSQRREPEPAGPFQLPALEGVWERLSLYRVGAELIE